MKPSGIAFTLQPNIGSNSLVLVLLTSVGSVNTNNGNARFIKAFLNYSNSFMPYTNLYISVHTQPVIIAVVVAIAGIIFPAIILVFY